MLDFIYALPSILLSAYQTTQSRFVTLLMKTSSPKKTRIFKYVSEAVIRKDYIDLSSWQSIELRAKLPKNTYWIQPSERGKIHWNIDLLQSYLLNGHCDQHQALVDEFLATIPRSA